MVDRPNVNRTIQRGYAQAQSAEIDAGLRAHMQKVYAYMAGGLGITGGVAFGVYRSAEFAPALFEGIIRNNLILMLVALGVAFFMSFRIHAIQVGTAKALFWTYAFILGLGLAPIFMVYTGESIARTFFISAGTFAAMSLWGYTTKRDLTGMGNFLIMGLFGIILASIVNIFLGSSGLGFAISVLGVLIFTGLTAYDTQKIKEMYWDADGADIAAKKSIMGAFTLYLDFINLFLMLLRFVGDRR
ncbi:Bax inhibitor-1/YccA family protein [Dongia rigui]|uniref:Bax inhibitor-1/YccA family protein n=1 Tax=Dongia rigui TaxID=940149 RepID=A0ABU5DX69_9PROT|nr:Bax inhibitor-1/YccA family protein [Dongia rigui]MDY0871887.1 Bax inhibitor-1/YccA family protein [Dongia rigui]